MQNLAYIRETLILIIQERATLRGKSPAETAMIGGDIVGRN